MDWAFQNDVERSATSLRYADGGEMINQWIIAFFVWVKYRANTQVCPYAKGKCYITENSGKVCKSLILCGAYPHKSLNSLEAKKFSGVLSI